MPYVLVPVPEEHEDELMEEVLKMSLRERLSAWDAEPLRALVGELEPSSRRLVTMLVEVSVDNRRLSETEVATSLGIDVVELKEMVEAINSRCRAQSLPYLVLTAPQQGPDDGVDLLITQVAANHLTSSPEPDRGTS